MALKVTFYNDVNFEKEGTSNSYVFNKRTKPVAGDFSDGGIYFTSYQEITDPKNPAPAHIIQKSYIYTLGSYVVNDPNINQAVITKANTTRTSNKLSENDCYVVTDIESDPYNKLLTVKKTNIKLGQIVDVASNAASFIGTLGTQIQTINLGSYSLTVAISPRGELTLSNSKLLADEIEYTYQKGNDESGTFNPEDTFNLSTNIYTLQFTTKTYIASAYITCAAAEKITFGDQNTQLSCSYHKNTSPISYNVVKVSIPASGWDASTYNANSYTFSVYIKTQGGKKDDIKYNSGEWNVNFKISKTPSPLVLNNPTRTVTEGEQTLSNIFKPSYITDSTGGTLGTLTWKMTEMSAQDVASGWGRFDLDNQQYTMGSAYEMKREEITVNCYYQCMVNTYSIYHQTEKQCTLKIKGGKQWTVNLNANGGTVDSTTVKNYYEGNLTLPTPTRDATSSATYTFNGWHTAATGGTQVSSPLKAGGTNVTWNNYTTTLYAHWNVTTITKYYWYIGTTNPAEMTTIEPIVGDDVSNGVGFRTLDMSKTYSASNKLYDGINNPIEGDKSETWYILLPTTSKLKFYDDLGESPLETITTTKDFGDGVKYTVYIRTASRPVVRVPLYIYH